MDSPVQPVAGQRQTRALAWPALPRGARPARPALFGEALVDRLPGGAVPGGAPLNVGRHLRAFGLRPLLISRLGEDAAAAQLLAYMRGAALDLEGMQFDAQHPTAEVRVSPGPEGNAFHIPDEAAFDFIDPGLATRAAGAGRPAVLYFGTLAQRHPRSREALHTLLRDHSALRLLDANLRPPWCERERVLHALSLADMVKLNEAEFQQVCSWSGLSADRDGALRLMERFGPRLLVVTRGAAGAWALGAGGGYITLPGRPPGRALAGADSVGAGDAFTAVVMLGLSRHWAVRRTLERAVDFAGRICGIAGALPGAAAFYRPFLEAWNLES